MGKLFAFLSVESAEDKFLQFHNRNDAERQCKCDYVFRKVDYCVAFCVCKVEETVDSGYKNHGGGKHKRTNHCNPQQLVVRLQAEHALVHAACVVRMEQFRH